MYILATETYTREMDVVIPVTQARSNLPRVIERAQTEAVFLERRGTVEAVVISPAQYARMQDALEEAEDIAAFDASLAERDSAIPWDEVKAELGWT
jgi:antitoxin Phd